MIESDGDIEYLEEDEEIVQQCVQMVQNPVVYQPPMPQLVERRTADIKRKKRKNASESDSDYNPNEDEMPSSPPRPKKKKTYPAKKAKTPTSLQSNVNVEYRNKSVPDRKKADIRIPDYDDPLCLPVKAIQEVENDEKRLKNWNNVCLEHFKHYDALLKPEKGETRTSTRTMIFKNVTNKISGKPETTIWTKTCVENEDGDRKSEIFQSVLPRFREKKTLSFNMMFRKPRSFVRKSEVVLSKEESNNDNLLVAYKPTEATVAVYKMMQPSKEDEADDAKNARKSVQDAKMYMQELACCKMCAPCFQTSWRGVRNVSQKSITCPLCKRSLVTIYNLLAHFKTHTAKDIQPYKKKISSMLAETVDYHYRCRICREKCPSIKKLREHVRLHNICSEVYVCEIGDHVVARLQRK